MIQDPAELEETLRNYDESFLACRDLRHVWEVVGFYRQGGLVRRLLRCARCPTERTDLWRSNGERVQASYSYPDGYRISGWHVDASDVRRAVIQRATIFESHDEMLQALSNRTPTRRRRR